MCKNELKESDESPQMDLRRYENIEKAEYNQNRFTTEITDTGVYFYDNDTRIFEGDMYRLLCSLEEEKQLIKDKLINEILKYERISDLNYYEGYNKVLEVVIGDIKELFDNPKDFKGVNVYESF